MNINSEMECSITANVEYMASWGLKSADLSTCEKVN